MPIQTGHFITKLATQGLLGVAKEGAVKLLQGQLTSDVTDALNSIASLSAHCNPQGRIISLFRLSYYQEQFILHMPAQLIPIATFALKKYAPFFKVELSDLSGVFTKIGYQGPGLPQVLGDLPDNINQALTSSYQIIKISENPARYEIMGPTSVIEQLWTQLSLVATISEESEWHSANIRAGIPSIYPETSEKFLPHEINLPALGGVSFKKGCYTGQEIIARMQYRGKLKNHLYTASVITEQPPVLNGSIYRNQDSCGFIVDFCQISYNHYMLLIIANSNYISTSTLSIDPENKFILTLGNKHV